MHIRITPQATLLRQTNYLRGHSDALAVLQEQAASGLKLNHPSDAPLDLGAVLAPAAEDGRLETHQANVGAVRDRLERGNTALLDANAILTRARQLAIEGANATNNPQSLEAVATEVDRLLERMLATGNATADGRYLFGGTATDQAAFIVTSADVLGRPMAVGYQGSQTSPLTPIDRDRQLETFQVGEQVFQQPGRDVFAELIGLRDELRNTGALAPGDQSRALSQRLGGLERAQEAIRGAIGEVSSSLEAIESLDARLGDVQTTVKIRIGELESADLAEVVVGLQARQTLLQSTLAATARTFNVSLLDFLQ